MLALLITASLALTEIDVLAREAAEERLDEAVRTYVAALLAGEDPPTLRRDVSLRAIALHAIYERDRMRQIDLAIDIRRLRETPSADPAEVERFEAELRELRAARDRYLARRAETELQQQTAIAAAQRFSRSRS